MGLTERQKQALAHDRHIALRAGAGSGKTMVLTRRYLSILESAGASVENIIAITFTEMAAAEMKTRIVSEVRKKIEEAARCSGKDSGAEGGGKCIRDTEEIRRWEHILDAMSDARVSTIHSFCASLLRENPVEAGVDPEFTVLDDTGQVLLLKETINDFINREAEEGNGEVRALSRLWSRRQLAEALETLFGARHKSLAWAAELSAMSDGEIRARHEELCSGGIDKLRGVSDLEGLLERLESLVCIDTGDRAYAMWQSAVSALRRICSEDTIPPDALDALTSLKFTAGSKKKWEDGHLEEFKAAGKQLRAWAGEVLRYRMNIRDYANAYAHRSLAGLFLSAFDYYEEAKGRGRILDFDDLQEKAALMLKTQPGVAAELRRQYRFIMVDEFQDTNPLQWEIISAIARNEDGVIGENVFLVGDEKQSIYAFRGADVRVFDAATRELDRSNAEVDVDSRLDLDVNFRSHPSLIDFFNSLFGRIFSITDTTGLLPRITCENIHSGRPGMWERIKTAGGAFGRDAGEKNGSEKASPQNRVHVLCAPPGGDEHDQYATRHDCEAEMAAAHIAEMLRRSDEFQVMDKSEERPRPLRSSDIAVLFRARTHITEYEEAFRREGIDFLNLGGFGFYERQEVADLLNVVSCLADPRDDVSLAGVLKSPMFGLEDETLLRMSREKGSGLFDRMRRYASVVGREDDGAAYAAERIAEWRQAAGHLPVPDLLLRILEETGLYGVYSTGGRGVQRRRNIEKFIGLARDFERDYSAGILSFARHLEEQQAMEMRLGEAPVVGDDSDAVRFMTVHASKGLEFPVVVVVSLGDSYHRGGAGVVNLEDFGGGRYEIGFRAPGGSKEDFALDSTAVNNVIKDLSRMRETDEMKRLLYVASTRAEDYLVLSGYCGSVPGGGEDADAAADAPRVAKKWSDEIEAALAHSDTRRAAGKYIQWFTEPPESVEREKREREFRAEELLDGLDRAHGRQGSGGAGDDDESLKYFGAVRDAAGCITVSVTELQDFVKDREEYRRHYLMKIPAQWTGKQAEPAAARSGKSRRVDPLTRGSAVHRLFEELYRVDDTGLETRFEDIMIDLNISGGERRELMREFLAKARAFRESETGRAIQSSTKYPEMPFLLKAGEHYLNGKIDMLYGSDGNWRIIDYKTDEVRSGEEAGRAEEYRLQMEAYALAALKGLASPRSVAAGVYFIKTGKHVEIANLTPGEAPAREKQLAAQLSELAAFRSGFE